MWLGSFSSFRYLYALNIFNKKNEKPAGTKITHMLSL